MTEQPFEQPAVPHEPIHASRETRRRLLPYFRVVLHKNAALELMFVVRTIMELMRLCRAEATHKMWEAYHCGRSVLLVTYKERAEFYAELFTERGLTVSIEPQE